MTPRLKRSKAAPAGTMLRRVDRGSQACNSQFNRFLNQPSLAVSLGQCHGQVKAARRLAIHVAVAENLSQHTVLRPQP